MAPAPEYREPLTWVGVALGWAVAIGAMGVLISLIWK